MLELADIADVVADAVKEATAPLLARIDTLERRELLLPKKGDPGEPGRDGEKGDPGEVDMDAVKALVEQAVAALPGPEKGVDGIEGPQGPAGEKGADGKAGADGKDGIGLADALIDKDGQLILTMTDGRTKALGVVAGKDGAPGKDGETFTLDDFELVPLDERTVDFRFTREGVCHSFELTFPVLIGRGIWTAEGEYQRGDVTTWGGTAWEAVEPEKGVKPDASSGGWRILAKRGRDGKS